MKHSSGIEILVLHVIVHAAHSKYNAFSTGTFSARFLINKSEQSVELQCYQVKLK